MGDLTIKSSSTSGRRLRPILLSSTDSRTELPKEAENPPKEAVVAEVEAEEAESNRAEAEAEATVRKTNQPARLPLLLRGLLLRSLLAE